MKNGIVKDDHGFSVMVGNDQDLAVIPGDLRDIAVISENNLVVV